jgi:iron complex transport system substrate-binding protein
MPRIVSLIASATEIVHVLGQTASQVGRSHECDFPEAVKALPVCTRPRIPVDGSSAEIDRQVKEASQNAESIYEVFDDLLERLQPTHILTQTQCEVCAVSLRDVERSVAEKLASRPRIVPLSGGSLSEIWDDIRRVAAALDLQDGGEPAISRLRHRMKAIADSVAGKPRRRVACLEWLDPLMAAGNWTPELIEMAGGQNLFGQAGRHSPWMTWEELLAADPDVIVAAPCGFDVERTRAEIGCLAQRPGWSALQSRLFLADGNRYFNRPGPSVVDTLEILAEILQNEGSRYAGTAWVPWEHASRGLA